PPCAPAPTMKSLDQVEARTPVDATHTPGTASSVFVISQPGSYYLTGNLTGLPAENGIVISANNVTLDLNGFAIIGTASMAGVMASNVQNITVRNGVVRDWHHGIDITITTNCRVEKICAYNNNGTGISTGMGCAIVSCVASANSAGISGNLQ